MTNVLRIPKVQLALTLFLIALTAILHASTEATVSIFLIAVSSTVFFDLLFISIRRVKLFIPYAAIVSGLIIGLLTAPGTAWYQVIVACAIAMGAKNFLRISGKHIFNPAGAGLLLAGILFHETISWWGVSFQTITSTLTPQNVAIFIILLLPLLVSAYRMRRYNSISFFLISYTILSFIGRSFTINSLFTTIFNPAIIFFSIVMLPEPMTSPVKMRSQMLYGMFVAFTIFLTSLPLITSFLSKVGLLTDPIIFALLLGNAVFFRFR